MLSEFVSLFKRLWRYLVSTHRGQVIFVVITVAVSLALRVFLFRFQGHPDEGWFTSWYYTAAEHGIRNFYSSIDTPYCDYPPLNVYIFWIFGKLTQAFGPDSLHIMLRLPQNLFDLGTALLIFFFVRQRYSYLFALGAMTVYTLNPATIFDLAVWGQMDSIYTFFMVGSLYAAMRSKHELSAGLLSLGILTKPQSVVLLPVVAYLILRNRGWKRAISSSAVFIILIFVVIAPFSWDNPISFLIDRYSGYNQFKYTSLNTYNFWALPGMWKDDTVSHLGLSYQTWGIIAFVIFAAFVMWQLHRKPEGRAPIFAAFLLMFGLFMLMTRMHERYLFPAFALLAMAFSPKFSPWAYIGLMGTYFFNLSYVLSKAHAYALSGNPSDFFIPDGHWTIYVVVPINAILFFYSIWNFWRMQRAKEIEGESLAIFPGPPEIKPAEAKPPAIPPPSPKVEAVEEEPLSPIPKVPIPWTHALILVLLVAIFLGVSLWNMGDRNVPSSDWVTQKDPEEVYVDLGTVTLVEKVWVLVADDNTVNVDLYWGSPGNWSYQTNLTESSVWYKWDSLNLDRDTRYVRLLFKGTSARIGEIALFTDGHKLGISSIVGNQDNTVTALIDEQQLVGNPARYTSGTCWDEIYYVRAAEQTLKLQTPTGAWDHPLMSKLLIAAGIAAFGHNPFAWRIPGVIVATLGILLIYFFAKRVFKSSRAGLIAAFLLTFCFMHFVEARITVPETYILFFVIAMFYFFYRYWEDPAHNGKYLFLSFAFFGLGFSTKWTVMFGFVGLVLLLIVPKVRKPVIRRSEVLWFVGGVAAAVAIYIAAYTTYFLAGHGWHDFWRLQLDMYHSQSGMRIPYAWSSAWYTWPLMLRPQYMYYGGFDGSTGYMSSLGNPALWWAGIAAILATFWLAIKQRNNIAIFISIPFLTQWLFFIPIHRPIMIYHFFPNVLFMVLAITLWAQWLWKRYSWGKWVVAGYLALNVVCFALFFPAISGLPMSEGYWHTMRWMVGWITTGAGPH